MRGYSYHEPFTTRDSFQAGAFLWKFLKNKLIDVLKKVLKIDNKFISSLNEWKKEMYRMDLEIENIRIFILCSLF